MTSNINMDDPISILLRASMHHFIGRAGKDPEIRYLDNRKYVANVNIAIKRPGSDETDWIQLEVWGESGQAFADQVRKGDLISVVGRIKSNRWTDRRTAEDRMQLCCNVKEWRVVSTPQGQGTAESARPPVAPPTAAPAAAPTAAPLPPRQSLVESAGLNLYNDIDIPF